MYLNFLNFDMMYHYKNILKLFSLHYLSSTLSFKFERMNFNLFKKKKNKLRRIILKIWIYIKKYYVSDSWILNGTEWE